MGTVQGSMLIIPVNLKSPKRGHKMSTKYASIDKILTQVLLLTKCHQVQAPCQLQKFAYPKSVFQIVGRVQVLITHKLHMIAKSVPGCEFHATS